MTASTDPTTPAPILVTPRYEPIVEAKTIWRVECPCGAIGEVRYDEAQANLDRDRHRTQHINEVIWPEGLLVRWCKRTGRNGDTVEWWKGTIVRHSGTHVVINVEGYRDHQVVGIEDLRRP